MILLTGFGFVSAINAQSATKLAADWIEKYKNYSIDSELGKQLAELPGEKVIIAFEAYLSDSLPRTRGGAYRMIYKTGVRDDNPSNRMLAVKILVKGLNDTDGGVIGKVIGYMQEFKPGDFDSEQRYNISMKVKEQPKPRYMHKLILLTGYLNIDELIYNYKQMLNDPAKYKEREQWNMKLAMARMGDEESANAVIKRISRLKLNDDVAYDIYPSLAYVRSKEAFDILFDGIMSKEKNCLSSNPDNEAAIICAFRILEYTAQYVEGFPIETDKFGAPIMDDYDAALVTVRKWIKTNKNDYKLITDKY